MTHDPLCPFFYDQTARELVRQTGNPCTYCDLIASVREDECRMHYGSGYKNGYSIALQSAGELVAWQLGKCHADSSTAIVLKKLIDWIEGLEYENVYR